MIPLGSDRGIIVGIGIPHCWYELILQTQLQGTVILRYTVKLMRRRLEQIVCQLERRDRMVAGGRRLVIVRSIPTKGQHLKETRPVQLVDIQAERGTRRIQAILFHHSGEQQLRECQRPAQSHLPAIDSRFGTVHPLTGLPFIGTAQTYAEGLTSTEHVSLGHTEDSSRT